MTISSQTASITAQGDASNTTFTYDFLIPYQADGVTAAVGAFVIQSGVRTDLTITTDFTITGVGVPAGGDVTYPVSGSPLAVGDYITIYRALDYVQETVMEDQGFRASQVETVDDTLEMQVQQVLLRTALVLDPCVVADLPAAAPNLNTRGLVTDATASTFASIVAGGGSTVVPVISNGTDWIIG